MCSYSQLLYLVCWHLGEEEVLFCLGLFLIVSKGQLNLRYGWEECEPKQVGAQMRWYACVVHAEIAIDMKGLLLLLLLLLLWLIYISTILCVHTPKWKEKKGKIAYLILDPLLPFRHFATDDKTKPQREKKKSLNSFFFFFFLFFFFRQRVF